MFGEQLITLKKGVNQKIKVSVVNTSDRDVEIPARMIVGDIELVSTVTPMGVRLKDSGGSTEVVDQEVLVDEMLDMGCNQVEVEAT